MKKNQFVQKKVREDVWAILQDTYNIPAPEPQSDTQNKLLDRIAYYVSEKISKKLPKTELEKLFR